MDSEIESLIADVSISAHLATAVGDRPHVAPVWYDYHDGHLRVLTGGRKLENVRRNPRVAVSIERADGPAVEWSVTLLGTADVVEDPERVREVSRRINAKYRGTDEAGDTSGGAMVDVTIGSASAQRY
ncbi:pyridoxamine 5'-phosphate oxidase family protein [Halalkalicoccus sp. NIPERK01]|uniref:pyridoxamine 5'-phosphate oxidase family protein n=1 Tax=Halalkalicoccus sp. NIPERK01 TaxID=3053469 RepID=UPI00256EDC0B|nr:pyridoxamine 5'-phosphate oxidase family protein [Halalkalicoccus sp. NIPERK01]MDL5360804.1 pyridoxamine 5'-phosphate oxidase family protein [Halalkalicoccus sp. NIPERK01]